MLMDMALGHASTSNAPMHARPRVLTCRNASLAVRTALRWETRARLQTPATCFGYRPMPLLDLALTCERRRRRLAGLGLLPSTARRPGSPQLAFQVLPRALGMAGSERACRKSLVSVIAYRLQAHQARFRSSMQQSKRCRQMALSRPLGLMGPPAYNSLFVSIPPTASTRSALLVPVSERAGRQSSASSIRHRYTTYAINNA